MSVSVSTGCFSGDTLVTLVNRKKIPIGKLQPGHQLLTTDGTTVFATEMMFMLDQNQHSSGNRDRSHILHHLCPLFCLAMFHTIVTASGHKLSLTGLHLLPTVSKDDALIYKPAKDIKASDVLRVVINDEVSSSAVINVTMEVKRAYYAPLTTSGMTTRSILIRVVHDVF